MNPTEATTICCSIYKVKQDTDDDKFNRYDENNFEVLRDIELYTNSGDKQYQLKFYINKITQFVPVKDYNNDITYYKLDLKRNQNIHQNQDLKPKDWTYIKYYFGKASGCEHYVRGCQLLCPICKDFFPCRFCHDDKIYDHEFPRYKVETVKCNKCDHVQKIGNTKCQYCSFYFGRYCAICRLYDGLSDEGKPIFHCYGCEMCMVGLKEQFIHCDACKSCYFKEKFKDHTCRRLNEECPACLEQLHGSQMAIVTPPCRHAIHCICMQNANSRFCPICRRPYSNNPEGDHKKNLQENINILNNIIQRFEDQKIEIIDINHFQRLEPVEALIVAHFAGIPVENAGINLQLLREYLQQLQQIQDLENRLHE